MITGKKWNRFWPLKGLKFGKIFEKELHSPDFMCSFLLSLFLLKEIFILILNDRLMLLTPFLSLWSVKGEKGNKWWMYSKRFLNQTYTKEWMEYEIEKLERTDDKWRIPAFG